MGDHEQNDICKEKFRQFDSHIEESKGFRDIVNRNAQRIMTLEQQSDKMDRAVASLTTAINGVQHEISMGVLKIVLSSSILALGVCVTVGVYINKVDTMERAVQKLERIYDHARYTSQVNIDK